MLVTSPEGEIIIEKKFHKSDFGDMLRDAQYKHYLEDLIEKVFVKSKVTSNDIDIDHESYEEVKSLSNELAQEDWVDPE